MYIARQIIKVNKNYSEEMRNAGEYTSTLLNYLDKNYNSRIEYIKSNTENTTDNYLNNNQDIDINKSKDKDLSNKDKSSTVDFVMDKKSIEMLDIYEGGGND